MESMKEERGHCSQRFEDLDALIQKDNKAGMHEFTTITNNGEIEEDDRSKVCLSKGPTLEM